MSNKGTVELDPTTLEAHIKEELPTGQPSVEIVEGRAKAGVMDRPAPLPPRIGLNPADKEAIFRLLELEEFEEENRELSEKLSQLNTNDRAEPRKKTVPEPTKKDKSTTRAEGQGIEKGTEAGTGTITSTSTSKGKGKGKGKERKSVTWSETSQVKEFVAHETLETEPTTRLAIEPAPPSSSSTAAGEVIPSIPFSAADRKRSSLSSGQTYEQPLAPEPETEDEPRTGKEKKEVMKTTVVERPMAPPRTPGAGSGAYKQSHFRANALAKPKPSVDGPAVSGPISAPATATATTSASTTTPIPKPHQTIPPPVVASSTTPEEATPIKSTVVERTVAPPTAPSSNKKPSVFSGKKKPAISSSSSSSSSSSTPISTTTTPSSSSSSTEKTSLPSPTIVKPMVVERSIDPPMVPKPGAFSEPISISREKGHSNVRPSEPSEPVSISTPVVTPSSGSQQPSSKARVEDPSDDEEEDDDSDGYVEFSDVDDNGEDYEIDMDDRMMMREATVNYYRLKNLIQSRGGMDGLLDQGAGLMPAEEFVPINATVSSDLSSSELAPETYASNGTSQSKFRSSVFGPSDTSSISLPTLVPGGGAKGALQNAIRVGRLENGKLVVGGVEGADGAENDDDDDADNDGEYDEEEEENIAAGKEALMWGMIGGVVVRPEDL